MESHQVGSFVEYWICFLIYIPLVASHISNYRMEKGSLQGSHKSEKVPTEQSKKIE